MALARIHRDARLVGPLEASTDGAVRRWWAGGDRAGDREQVEALLSALRGTGQWLACDCLGHAAAILSPLLAPAKTEGTLYLRRLSKRAGHAPTCVFWSEQTVREPIDLEGGPGAVVIGSAPSFVDAEENETAVSNPTREPNAGEPASSRAAPIPKLAKQLFWLAVMAGWQHAPMAASPIKSLLRTSEEVPVAGDLRLRQLLFCNPNVWLAGWADAAFRKCDAAGIGPACWWVQLCTAFDRQARDVTFATEKGPLVVKVHQSMTVFGGDASAARFPLLVASVLRWLPRHGVVLYSAYAHPVASEDHLMLLNSDLERATLRDLLSVCTWLQDEKGILVEIDKPLHAWRQTSERPDFVLTLKSSAGAEKCLVIKTMGYDDPAYETRKAELARKVDWPVYFDRRSGQDKESGKALKSVVAKWAIGLRRPVSDGSSQAVV